MNFVSQLKLLLLVVCMMAAPAAGAKQPNILYIMADDLNADWKNDRLAYMPNVKKYFKEEGTEFENHVAAIPVCGPSRSSMLLGRYPHNTGYKQNGDPASSKAFLQEANNTVGSWLKDAGYYTAFFGKYVNNCENKVPSGWSYWGGLVTTYDFYNATIWEMDWEEPDFGPPKTRLMTHVHQADFLGNFTVEHATKAVAANRPFFISVTPVMPHWGTCYGPGPGSVYPEYDPHWEFNLAAKNLSCGDTCAMPISPCPTDRNRHKFDGQTNPHIKGVWNVSIKGNRPVFMKKLESTSGHLTPFQEWREDIGWQNRSASLIDLDEMIGAIIEGVDALGVLNETVIFFTR
jgi:arylsulfatase A-like enzyme